jgi:hypothetical protein
MSFHPPFLPIFIGKTPAIARRRLPSVPLLYAVRTFLFMPWFALWQEAISRLPVLVFYHNFVSFVSMGYL